MKNRRSLLSLGILALILVLGVGYAVVSATDLTFGGTATVKDADIKVDICGVTEKSTIATNGATVKHTLTEHSDKASFEISNMVLNEEVTITYTVTNHETDVAAKLSEKTGLTNSNPEYFSATYTIAEENIAAEGSTTVVVKVKLIKTPVVEADASTKIDFVLTANPVDNNN